MPTSESGLQYEEGDNCAHCGQAGGSERKLRRLLMTTLKRSERGQFAMDRLAAIKAECLDSRSPLAKKLLSICDGVTPIPSPPPNPTACGESRE